MKIDFYVLEQTDYQQALLLACNVVEDAHNNQQSVYIHASSLEEANKIDELLWSFRDDSFLPHNLYDAADACPPPIQIGHDATPPHQAVLVNLSKEVPKFYQQFQQVIEIVFSEPSVQQLARERYKHYRESGYDITTHKIKAN